MSNIDASTAAKQLRSLLDRTMTGESFTITRYGRPVATLAPLTQMDVPIAAAPTHRPPKVAPVVSNSTTSNPYLVIEAGAEVLPPTASTKGVAREGSPATAPPSYSARHPDQAARDELLGKIGRKK